VSATRISGAPTAAGAFAVPSSSRPGESWLVEWVTAGTCWCACPAFARKQDCRHVAAVAALIQAEARTSTTPEQRAQAAARLDQIAEEFAL